MKSTSRHSLHTGEVIGSIPIAPTIKSLCLVGFFGSRNFSHPAGVGRTEPKHGTWTRGKSVEYVRAMFARDDLQKGGERSRRYKLPDLTIELNERRPFAIAGQGFKFQLHHHNDASAALKVIFCGG
jgi:hypothetical protein